MKTTSWRCAWSLNNSPEKSWLTLPSLLLGTIISREFQNGWRQQGGQYLKEGVTRMCRYGETRVGVQKSSPPSGSSICAGTNSLLHLLVLASYQGTLEIFKVQLTVMECRSGEREAEATCIVADQAAEVDRHVQLPVPLRLTPTNDTDSFSLVVGVDFDLSMEVWAAKQRQFVFHWVEPAVSWRWLVTIVPDHRYTIMVHIKGPVFTPVMVQWLSVVFLSWWETVVFYQHRI